MKTNMDEKSANRPWQKTKHANLVRNVSPGKYFARFRSNGKLFWRSLETDVLSTAAQRLTSAAEPYNASGKHEADMSDSVCRLNQLRPLPDILNMPPICTPITGDCRRRTWTWLSFLQLAHPRLI